MRYTKQAKYEAAIGKHWIHETQYYTLIFYKNYPDREVVDAAVDASRPKIEKL